MLKQEREVLRHSARSCTKSEKRVSLTPWVWGLRSLGQGLMAVTLTSHAMKYIPVDDMMKSRCDLKSFSLVNNVRNVVNIAVMV